MTDAKTQTLEIIGFDLGHGETALARVYSDREADPEMLELYGRKSQMTAVGRHPDKGVVIGERALILPDMTSFEICFKQRPSPDSLYRRNIQDYAAACHAHLVSQGQIADGASLRYYVGCPSGWPDDIIGAYTEILAAASLPSLRVVRESRAALLHAKECGKLTLGELKQGVLIVDLGSSTTDFTLVRGATEIPLDFGDDLGAALIDRAILRRTLETHEQRETLERIFCAHPLHRARCEMQCRKAKETYFANEDLYANSDCPVQSGFERIQDVAVFDPAVNGAVMQQILNEPRPELEGCSWMGRFGDLVAEARQRLDQNGMMPAALLLTGGASRMGFVRSVCEVIFPESDVRRDSEPEYCIARGLARWGRVDIRTTAFEAEVNRFMDEELDGLIAASIPELKQQLAACLTTGLLEDVVQAGLLAWRDGDIPTLAELEPHMRRAAESWIKSEAAQHRIAEYCGKWFSPLQQQLNQQTDRICQGHRVPAGVLSLDASLGTANLDTSKVSLPRANPTARILNVGAAVTSLLVASLLGGGGWALLMAGPIGWGIGLVLGGSAAYWGKPKTEAYLKSINMPIAIRKMILRDTTVAEQQRHARPTLRSEVKRQVDQLEEPFEQLADDLRIQLRTSLKAKADEARLLIS
ncbi:MAG TPA: hypothetical protein PKN33_03050 [Phycisphaerae bacterium]|nr:hypothetical protein [Phycisphaerae bacterium]